MNNDFLIKRWLAGVNYSVWMHDTRTHKAFLTWNVMHNEGKLVSMSQDSDTAAHAMGLGLKNAPQGQWEIIDDWKLSAIKFALGMGAVAHCDPNPNRIVTIFGKTMNGRAPLGPDYILLMVGGVVKFGSVACIGRYCKDREYWDERH